MVTVNLSLLLLFLYLASSRLNPTSIPLGKVDSPAKESQVRHKTRIIESNFNKKRMNFDSHYKNRKSGLKNNRTHALHSHC